MSKSKKERPSPTESATSYNVGTKRKGNNGKMWVVGKNKNGVKRWNKLGKNKNGVKRWNKLGRSYFILDNGGSPFLVYVNKATAEIYKRSNPNDESYGVKEKYDKLVKRYTNVKKKFIGKSPINKMTSFSGGHGPRFDGNSILLSLPNDKYVFIGERIYEFTAPEPITKYYSAVGNSSVPYPVALSKNYAYFMIGPSMHYKEKNKNGGEYIPKKLFPKDTDWSDAYTQYYDLFPHKWYKHRKGKTCQMKHVKLIHKRIW